MLVIVDPHPAFPGIIRAEERLEVAHLAGEIQCRIFFPRRRFSKTERVGFLHGVELREGRAGVGGVVKAVGAKCQPEIALQTGRRRQHGARAAPAAGIFCRWQSRCCGSKGSSSVGAHQNAAGGRVAGVKPLRIQRVSNDATGRKSRTSGPVSPFIHGVVWHNSPLRPHDGLAVRRDRNGAGAEAVGWFAGEGFPGPAAVL